MSVKRYGFVVAAAVGSSVTGVAHAGTVINTNVPVGTSIVNIDAQTDGAGSFNSGGTSDSQSYWTQPFSTNGTLPTLTLQPGTYTFRVISQTDAQTAFPSLTPAQVTQVYTAWTYNTPWVTNYMVFRSTAQTNAAETQIFDGGATPAGVPYNTGSPALAYNSLVSSGYQDNIRLAPPGRSGTTAASFVNESYTFAAPTTLLFVVPDNGVSDNGGGVSVVVSPVPEPSTAAVFAGVAVHLGVRRRRKSA